MVSKFEQLLTSKHPATDIYIPQEAFTQPTCPLAEPRWVENVFGNSVVNEEGAFLDSKGLVLAHFFDLLVWGVKKYTGDTSEEIDPLTDRMTLPVIIKRVDLVAGLDSFSGDRKPHGVGDVNALIQLPNGIMLLGEMHGIKCEVRRAVVPNRQEQLSMLFTKSRAKVTQPVSL